MVRAARSPLRAPKYGSFIQRPFDQTVTWNVVSELAKCAGQRGERQDPARPDGGHFRWFAGANVQRRPKRSRYPSSFNNAEGLSAGMFFRCSDTNFIG